jgi:hypothetical protein
VDAIARHGNVIIRATYIEYQPCLRDLVASRRPIPLRCALNVAYEFKNGDHINFSFVEDVPARPGVLQAFFLDSTRVGGINDTSGHAAVQSDIQTYGTPAESNFTSQYWAEWFDVPTAGGSWSISSPRFEPYGWQDLVPSLLEHTRRGVLQTSYDNNGYSRFVAAFGYAEPRLGYLRSAALSHGVRPWSYERRAGT